MTVRRLLPATLATAFLGGLPTGAFASAFQILEQSPARLGTAFAGTASAADDASTVFFNPAGMTQLEGSNLTLGANVIVVDSAFDNGGSTAATGTGLQRPLAGVEDNTDKPGLVPNIYYTHPLSERVTFGVGINAPFGLASEYDDDWQGRYHATDSELETLNINATFAYAVNDALSLGFGLSYQRADTMLKSELDSFNLCRRAGGGAGACAGAHGGPGNRASDSSSKIEGDDHDAVFDVSIHWQPTQDTALGATWRQGGDYSLRGDGEFSPSASCAQDPFCSGAIAQLAGNIQAEASFPDTLTLSASHRLNRRWSLHADIAWTEWSTLQSISIDNVGTGQTVDTLELEYDDTVRYALGTTLRTDGPWTWRAGVAFDEAPQTDASLVTPRIPDQDRTWLAFGFNYRFANDLTLDVGYAHLFVDDVEIDSVSQGNTLRGEFDASVDILALQANWRF